MFFHLHLSFTSLLSKFETSMHCKNVHQEDIHDRYTKKFVDFMSQIDAFKTKNRGRVVTFQIPNPLLIYIRPNFKV